MRQRPPTTSPGAHAAVISQTGPEASRASGISRGRARATRCALPHAQVEGWSASRAGGGRTVPALVAGRPRKDVPRSGASQTQDRHGRSSSAKRHRSNGAGRRGPALGQSSGSPRVGSTVRMGVQLLSSPAQCRTGMTARGAVTGTGESRIAAARRRGTRALGSKRTVGLVGPDEGLRAGWSARQEETVATSAVARASGTGSVDQVARSGRVVTGAFHIRWAHRRGERRSPRPVGTAEPCRARASARLSRGACQKYRPPRARRDQSSPPPYRWHVTRSQGLRNAGVLFISAAEPPGSTGQHRDPSDGVTSPPSGQSQRPDRVPRPSCPSPRGAATRLGVSARPVPSPGCPLQPSLHRPASNRASCPLLDQRPSHQPFLPARKSSSPLGKAAFSLNEAVRKRKEASTLTSVFKNSRPEAGLITKICVTR